jgi:glutaconate CoA-transferase subunit A
VGPLAIEEHSHAAMACAYESGAANLPFGILRGYRGVQLTEVNPNIRAVTCPFTGESLAAVPAIRPDVGIIHAQRADGAGNVLIEGILGVQKEVVLAARRAIVTVEEIVPSLHGTHPNACILPHWAVTSVCVAPRGALPSYAYGYYPRDNARYLQWDAISRDRRSFIDWLQREVLTRIAMSPSEEIVER